MFDPDDRGQIIHDPSRRSPRAPGDSYMGEMEAEARHRAGIPQRKMSALDEAEMARTHQVLMGHYMRELDVQADNREQMALDEAFYDHEQWSPEELAELAGRGQPPLIFNLIQPAVNWMLGSQRRSRTDYKILPRRKDGAAAAERKTALLSYMRDVNRAEYAWSDAFRDQVRVGLGWMECGQGDVMQGTAVFERHESWRNMLHDSAANEYDLSDARYLFRSKWVDADIALGMFPKRAGAVRTSISDTPRFGYTNEDSGDRAMDSREELIAQAWGSRSSQFDAPRGRVRLIEAWFRRMVPDAIMIRGGQFSGELFDEWSPGHWADVRDERASLVVMPRQVIYVAMMTETGLLGMRKSPYRHNRFPFTPIWGYRRAKDGLPYGLIRGIRDIQRDFNKRASKALHHLSTVRVHVQEGAVPDIEELRDEAARPDAVIVHKSGFQPPTIANGTEVAQAHVGLMQQDSALLMQVSGVTPENMGHNTNTISGKAIIAKQDQGALATASFFDNFGRSRSIHGEKQLINIEQFYTDELQFRITNERGVPEYVTINDGNPDNDIAETKADFIISEEDWRASYRQAQAAALLELFQQLAATAPQIVLNLLDLLVEALDVPKRDEIVRRIRQMTGQNDPDADPAAPPSPEEAARKAAQAAQAQMQQRGALAQIAEAEAKARRTNAEAAEREARIASTAIDQFRSAIETALAGAQAAGVAGAADEILAHALQAAQAARAGGNNQAATPQQPQMPVGTPQQPPEEGVIQ